MDTQTQFQKNATVLTADGHQLGTLNRIVINPSNNMLTNIVVRTGVFLHSEEKVIPIDLVAETTKDQIVLNDHLHNVDSLPPFEERHLVDANGNPHSDQEPFLENMPLILLGKPDFGMRIAPDTADQFVTQLEKNIPEGTVAIKEGAKIITAEGKHAGNMEGAFADPYFDQITHLLISSGLLTKELKLLPINWVMLMGENEVRLCVGRASLEELDNVPYIV